MLPSIEEEDGNMGKLQHQSPIGHVCKKENSIEEVLRSKCLKRDLEHVTVIPTTKETNLPCRHSLSDVEMVNHD